MYIYIYMCSCNLFEMLGTPLKTCVKSTGLPWKLWNCRIWCDITVVIFCAKTLCTDFAQKITTVMSHPILQFQSFHGSPVDEILAVVITIDFWQSQLEFKHVCAWLIQCITWLIHELSSSWIYLPQICTCVCACVYMCVYACVCVCINAPWSALSSSASSPPPFSDLSGLNIRLGLWVCSIR